MPEEKKKDEVTVEPERRRRFEYDEEDAEYLLGHVSNRPDENKEGQSETTEEESQ